jgi:hypothetical protein
MPQPLLSLQPPQLVQMQQPQAFGGMPPWTGRAVYSQGGPQFYTSAMQPAFASFGAPGGF